MRSRVRWVRRMDGTWVAMATESVLAGQIVFEANDGERLDAIIAERAAPLVEALESIVRLSTSMPAELMRIYDGQIECVCRDALARYRGAGGGGDA